MAKKQKTSSHFNTINEILTIARERQIIHLNTQDYSLDGKTVTVNGKKLINFGSCSYLGLETDQRLKEGAVDAVMRYGSQFSCSRAYLSFTLYEELEELIGKMFNSRVILSTCTTLGHQAVIPVVVEDNDAVVLDQQAHFSMQEVFQNLQLRGITVTKVRHSRLDELQEKITQLSEKHEKIWYVIDGVYSMYGDLAPMEELTQLLNKNKNLYLYVDDAHGMSWAGINGTGAVLSQIKLHPRIILATSLAKGFGSAGGVFILPTEEMYWKVKNWGGPLTHSGPQQPAVVGASIAAAKIHLSDEIYQRQNDLSEKVLYCNKVLNDLNLPVIGDSISPIFFIGLGLTKVGYNMVRRMVDDGLYVNLGVFPAVPETCTGIRFTINLHHTNDDIDRLAERLAFHFPKALQQEERSVNDIYRAFRSLKKFKNNESHNPAVTVNKKFIVQQEKSIHSISSQLWDQLLGNRGAFDWKALASLEEVFQGNQKREDNWDFHYIIIRDQYNKPVLATFFTTALVKDDMLVAREISKSIEEMRAQDEYYLTSKTLMMGSLITEGDHLFIDRNNPNWKAAIMEMLDTVWKIQEKEEIPNILLRDFEGPDTELRDFLTDQGFVKVDVPEGHEFEVNDLKTREDYISSLTSKKRNLLKKNALKLEHHFNVEIVENASDDQVQKWYELYNNVRDRNFEINGFPIPFKMFQMMAKSPLWECLQLSVKNAENKDVIASVMFNYKGKNYTSMIVGMDYTYLETLNVYKQTLFQTFARGVESGAKKIHMGLTASLEKRKLGAVALERVAYVQMKDQLNMALINLMPKAAEHKRK